MIENKLKKLRDIVPPAPRVEAKRAALTAALESFDAAGDVSDTQDTVPPAISTSQNNNTQLPSKGLRRLFRHTRISSDTKRKRSMHVSRNYAIAASLAALMIAAPAAFHLMKTERLNQSDLYGLSDERPDTGLVEKLTRELNQPADTEVADVKSPAPRPAPAVTTYGEKLKAEVNKVTVKPPAKTALSKDDFGGARSTEGRVVARKLMEVQRSRRQRLGAASGNVQLGAAPKRPAPAVQFDSLGGLYAEPSLNLQNGPAAAQRFSGSINIPGEHDGVLIRPEQFRDVFDGKPANPVKQVAVEPVSTFSIDVDTASYSFVRRSLMQGQLPPAGAVRVEELINYFPYDYTPPEDASVPFKPTVTVAPVPWNANNKLLHIAIKGHDVKATERPRANLVFLIDVSGSMASPDKLPLLKNAFRMLLDELQPDDTVALVTYASGSGVALPPTKVTDKSKILNAIASLGAGGSTAGAQGIQDAYSLAESNFDKSGVNRIILATDGDFNVGITNRKQLKQLVERKRKAGIFLSVMGFGRGNYNDALMQALAQNGNGTAAYIDTLNEARKVLVDESSSTLFTIAKDVKIQLEFNPKQVSEYRLIGYETRNLKREDFNNDKVDAGDIGSGHTVTAIYELTPVGAPKSVDDLRYQAEAVEKAPTTDVSSNELGFLKLRYKLPKEKASKLLTLPITPALEKSSIDAAGQEVRFSTAVAAFGQLLRNSQYVGDYSYDDVIKLAQGARGQDRFGYRAEFLNLVRLAKSSKP